MNKILVAYFSASGQTARLAKTIADAAGGELFEIVPAQIYTPNDLNWHDSNSRSSLEMKDASSRPAIANLKPNLDAYDTVYVGFPIWWYEAPRIIQTFLQSYDFSAKSVVLFATSGGSGMGQTQNILAQICKANFKSTGVMSSYASKNDVLNLIKKLN